MHSAYYSVRSHASLSARLYPAFNGVRMRWFRDYFLPPLTLTRRDYWRRALPLAAFLLALVWALSAAGVTLRLPAGAANVSVLWFLWVIWLPLTPLTWRRLSTVLGRWPARVLMLALWVSPLLPWAMLAAHNFDWHMTKAFAAGVETPLDAVAMTPAIVASGALDAMVMAGAGIFLALVAVAILATLHIFTLIVLLSPDRSPRPPSTPFDLKEQNK